MKRKVYLEGEMGERFGKEFEMVADSFVEVFRCLKCNFNGLMPYLQECHEKNIGFLCEVEGKPLKSEEEFMLLYKEGDMIITPLPAGSKSGAGKLLAAVAVTVMTAGMGAFAIGAMGGGGLAGGLAAAGSMFGAGIGGITATLSGMMGAGGALGALANAGIGLGINLALGGLQQMMSPDPSTDNEQDESYIFQGAKQNIAEGDPVPVLYGELRIPGRTISFHTRAEQTAFYNNNSRAVSSESGANSYSEAVNQQAGGTSSAGNGGVTWTLASVMADPH